MPYVLDMDDIGALQRNDLRVLLKLQGIPADELLVTIISLEEQLRGRLNSVHNPKGAGGLIAAYSALAATFEFYRRSQVLPYDAAAELVDRHLQASVPRMGTMDRRIASITISRGGTLVTRNTVDYQRVRELALENWL